jgi:hypothetical protein
LVLEHHSHEHLLQCCNQSVGWLSCSLDSFRES